MKTFLVSAVAAMAIVYHPQAYGQAAQPIGPGSVKIGKIEPAGVKSPEYQITGGPQKRSKVGTWLEVEVEFDTKNDDIDELTFNYTIAIENKLLVGSVTHINIPGGKDHYSVVYIAPRSLEKLVGNHPLTGASIQNVWVNVTRQGQLLAKGSMKPPIDPPNAAQITGMILNKGETPFAPLFYDRYEAIKPASR